MCKGFLRKTENIVLGWVKDRFFERFYKKRREWIFFIKLFVVKINCFIFASLWLKTIQIRVSSLS